MRLTAVYLPESLERRVLLSDPAQVVVQSFDAADEQIGAYSPPDTMGAIGPNYFVESVNGVVLVYDRASHELVSHSTATSFFTVMIGGVQYPRLGGMSDPRITYDAQSSRWFSTSLELPNNPMQPSFKNVVILAVSQTSDPTGSWDKYVVDVGALDPNGNPCLTDYDTLAVDSNGVYVTVDLLYEYAPGLMAQLGERIAAISKQALLQGSLGAPFFSNVLVDLGETWEPAMSPGVPDPAGREWFAQGGGNGITLRALSWNNGIASLETNTYEMSLPVGAHPPIPAASPNGDLIDTGDDRLLTAVYRNGHLLGASNVGLNITGGQSADRVGVEWFDVDLTGAQPALAQTGRIYDQVTPGNAGPMNYYYPSLMVNGLGDVAIGFSGSSASQFISAYATGRLYTDALGTTRDIATIKAGLGPYHGGTPIRWGDYSATSIDPADDLGMWTIQEYAENNPGDVNVFTWGTFVAELEASVGATVVNPNASCGTGRTNYALDLTGTRLYNAPAWITTGQMQAQISGDGISSVAVRYAGPTNTTVTFDIAANATAGARTVTITNADGQVIALPGAFSVLNRAYLASSVPGAPDLASISDTGISSTDNITSMNNHDASRTLLFTIPGTVVGALVTLYVDGRALGSVTATGTSTTIATNGSYRLGEGTHLVTARQTEAGKDQSVDSAELTITVDTVPPRVIGFVNEPDPDGNAWISAVEIQFSEPIPAPGGQQLQIDYSPDLRLNRDGGTTNLLTGAEEITSEPSSSWLRVANLPATTRGTGTWLFTVLAGGRILDFAGNALPIPANDAWINGTNGNDSVQVAMIFAREATITVNGTASTPVIFDNLLLVQMSGYGGNDTGTVDLSAAPLPNTAAILFDGGPGVNELQITGSPVADSITFNGPHLVYYAAFSTSVISFENTQSLTLSAGVGNDVLTQSTPSSAAVTLNATAGSVALNTTANHNAVNLAALNIADGARVNVPANGSRVIKTNSLTLTGTATLDLFDNDLIVQSDGVGRTTVLGNVSGWIGSARGSGGSWLGNGITSTAAKNDPAHVTGLAPIINEKLDPVGQPYAMYATFDGQAVDRNSILVKYSYNGDANVDGLINFDDYYQINTGFLGQSSQPPLSGYRWGDFNLSGIINFDDYFLINTAFLGQGNTILGPSQLDEESDLPGDALSIPPGPSTLDSYQPGLTIDLFDSSTGLKEVPVLYVGQVVTLSVFATVSGSDPDAYQALQSLVGSFVATQVNGGAVNGRISRHTMDSTFKSSGWSYGTQQDLNGDGNLDLGSNNPESATGWWIANASSMDWAPDPGTYTWFLGTIRFTVTGVLAAGGRTEINFRGRDGWDNGALWMVDGVLENGSSPDIHIGAPVVLTR